MMKKIRTHVAPLAILLAAIASAPALAEGVTAPVEAPILSLSVRLFNPATREVVDCDDRAALTTEQAQKCLEMTPIVRVPTSSSSSDSDTIVGWHSRTVHSDYISESCGRYRAQDGFINCEIYFGGSRKVTWVGLIYCGCSDPAYTTTGVVHNYDVEGDIMYWGAYRDSRPVGQSYEECWDYIATDSTTTGVTGGIHDNSWTGSHCYIPWSQVKGTWGISVDYKKTSGDSNKRSEHSYVKATARTP